MYFLKMNYKLESKLQGEISKTSNHPYGRRSKHIRFLLYINSQDINIFSMLLGRKAVTNLDSILKSRNITLPTKVRLVKAMVFFQ